MYELQGIFEYDPPIINVKMINRLPKLTTVNGFTTELDKYNTLRDKYLLEYYESKYHSIYLQEYKRLAQSYAIKLYLASRHSILVGNFANCMTNMFTNINGLFPPFNGPHPFRTFEDAIDHLVENRDDIRFLISHAFTYTATPRDINNNVGN